MSLTITTANPNDTNPITVPTTPATQPRQGAARWPIFGVVAGVTGWLAGLASISNAVSKEEANEGVGVVEHLSRGGYYASFLLGLVSIASLLIAAAGWRRWAEERAPRHLASRTIASALGATATMNILGTALAGSMAIYLPGGSDQGWMSDEALFVNFTMLDFGQLLGWWGAMVAAGSVAALSLPKRRFLPRWMGIVSIVLMLPAIVFAAATGLPGFPGLVMPIWLVIISLGMMKARNGGSVDVV
ncbi:MAG: hypothetical protein HZB15_13025 [Actinobacteria bacterium]|nr:hypothetical protein [Actinomycetota bacterium]